MKMKILLGLIAVITIGVGLCSQENSPEFPIENATVGENITLYCNFSSNEILIWYINDSYYSWTTLPDDYYLSLDNDQYILVIPVVKLWMNNTAFTCYGVRSQTEKPVVKLYVSFDFTGPSDLKVSPNSVVLIPCKSSLEILSGSFSTWSINGTIYTPFTLPDSYYWTPNGLIIHPTKEDMNGTTLQCLILSNYLLGNSYYYSNVGTLQVLDKFKQTFCEEPIACLLDKPRFHFDHQHFSLNPNYTIAWTAATECQEPVNYYIVGTLNSTLQYKLNVSSATNYTLEQDYVKSNTSQPYEIYIEAIAIGSDTPCAFSSRYLIIPHSVTTTVQVNLTGENSCFPVIQNKSIILPYLPTFKDIYQKNECPCLDVSNLLHCGCLNETGFKVVINDAKDMICLNDLTSEMNETKIIFHSALSVKHYDEHIFPGEEISNIFEIIIGEQPGSPTLYLVNKTSVCIRDNYNGHLKILNYNITITNNIQISYSFNGSLQEPCTSIPSEATSIINSDCAPVYVQAVSMNRAGPSSPSEPRIINYNQDPNKCSCINDTFRINIINTSSTVDTIEINVICATEYYYHENLRFIFQLDDANKNVGYKCSKWSYPIQFSNLVSGKSYNITLHAVISDSRDNNCVLQRNIGPYSTESKSLDEHELIVIFIVLGVILGVIIIVLSIVLCICCPYVIKYCKMKRRT